MGPARNRYQDEIQCARIALEETPVRENGGVGGGRRELERLGAASGGNVNLSPLSKGRRTKGPRAPPPEPWANFILCGWRSAMRMIMAATVNDRSNMSKGK